MYIKYDEYELLELFESEPIIIAEKEAGIFIYRLNDDMGFKLVMNLSIYENECSVSLSYNEKIIFDIQLKCVEFIKGDNEKLRIHRKNNDRDLIIRFKPYISIKIENI